MKGKCAKCGAELDTERGNIITIVPVPFKREMLEFTLCRPHFLEAEKYRIGPDAFRKWIHKKEKK